MSKEEFDKTYKALLELNEANLALCGRLSAQPPLALQLSTVRLDHRLLSLEYNMKPLQFTGFGGVFERVRNLFKDPLPEGNYFDLREAIERYSLLSKKKGVEYLREWKEALEAVQGSVKKIEEEGEACREATSKVMEILGGGDTAPLLSTTGRSGSEDKTGGDVDGKGNKSEDQKTHFYLEKRQDSPIERIELAFTIDMASSTALDQLRSVMQLVHSHFLVKPLSEFALDPLTVVGPVTVGSDGKSISKENLSDGSLSALAGFSQGSHRWTVRCTAAVQGSNDAWLLIGVLDKPKAGSASSYKEGGCFGVAVNTTSDNSEWIGGKQKNKGEYKITLGDDVVVELDVDACSLAVSHKNWHTKIALPAGKKKWFPHFSVYSLLFAVNKID